MFPTTGGTLRGVGPDGRGARVLEESARGRVVGLFVVNDGGNGRKADGPPGQLVLDGRPAGSLGSLLERASGGNAVADGTVEDRLTRGIVRNAGRSAAADPATRRGAYRWFLGEPIRFGSSLAVVVSDSPSDESKPAAPHAGRSAALALFWYSERPRPGRLGR